MGGREDIQLIALSTSPTSKDGLRVLHTLSAPLGRCSFLCSRSGRQGTAALCMPMSLLEASVAEHPRASLGRLRDIRPSHPLSGIRNSPWKNAITLFMAEALLRLLREGIPDAGVYAWCRGKILALDALEGNYANFPVRFLAELSAQLGLEPSPRTLLPFSGNMGGGVLEPLLGEDFARAMLVPLTGERRNLLCQALLRFLEHHLDMPLPLRSLAVLREVSESW